MKEWLTTAEAAEVLKISERQVRNKVKSGALKAKKDGQRWLIHSSMTEPEAEVGRKSATSDLLMSKLEADNAWLRERIQELEGKLAEAERKLEERIRASEEASERHDTIVLQLTRQIDQGQRLLEYHRLPLWRRLFARKGKDIESKNREG